MDYYKNYLIRHTIHINKTWISRFSIKKCKFLDVGILIAFFFLVLKIYFQNRVCLSRVVVRNCNNVRCESVSSHYQWRTRTEDFLCAQSGKDTGRNGWNVQQMEHLWNCKYLFSFSTFDMLSHSHITNDYTSAKIPAISLVETWSHDIQY